MQMQDPKRHPPSSKTKLLLLAQQLEDTPKLGYSMAYWSTCAVGMAARNPVFNAMGLTLERSPGYFLPTVAYGPWRGCSAVAKFFDLSVDNVDHLFGIGVETDDFEIVYRDAETPAETAARIRKFIGVPREVKPPVFSRVLAFAGL